MKLSRALVLLAAAVLSLHASAQAPNGLSLLYSNGGASDVVGNGSSGSDSLLAAQPPNTVLCNSGTGSASPKPCAKDYINAVDFGADPTHTNDSAPGINSALTTADASGKYGTVFLPCGVYHVKSPLVLGSASSPNSQTLQGAGWCTVIDVSNDFTPTATGTISSPRVTGSAGQFSCSCSGLVPWISVIVTGANSGTGSISGYVSGTRYYLSAVGTNTFTLQTGGHGSSGTRLTTTTGTLTGLTFTPESGVIQLAGFNPAYADQQLAVKDLVIRFHQPSDITATVTAVSGRTLTVGTSQATALAHAGIGSGSYAYDTTHNSAITENNIPAPSSNVPATTVSSINTSTGVITFSASVASVAVGDHMDFAQPRAACVPLSSNPVLTAGAPCIKYPWAIFSSAASATRYEHILIEGAWDGLYIRGSSFVAESIFSSSLDQGFNDDEVFNFSHLNNFMVYSGWGWAHNQLTTDFPQTGPAFAQIYYDGNTVCANFYANSGLAVHGLQCWFSKVNINSSGFVGLFDELMLDGQGSLNVINTDSSGAKISSMYCSGSYTGTTVYCINDSGGYLWITNFWNVTSYPNTPVNVTGGELHILGPGFMRDGLASASPAFSCSGGVLDVRNMELTSGAGSYSAPYFSITGSCVAHIESNYWNSVASGSAFNSGMADNVGTEIINNNFGSNWAPNLPTSCQTNGTYGPNIAPSSNLSGLNFCHSPPLVLVNTGIPVGLAPSGYIDANGYFLIGQQLTPTVHLSSSTAGTGIRIMCSAPCLAGTSAGDVGRVLMFPDGTCCGSVKTAIVTAFSSTTSATATLNTTLTTACTSGSPCSGVYMSGPVYSATQTAGAGCASNCSGTNVFSAPFDRTYSDIYLWFGNSSPYNAHAVVLFCEMSYLTYGQCFKNRLSISNGTFSIPSSPTVFSGLAAATYSRTTPTNPIVFSATIPVGGMGLNGDVSCKLLAMANDDSNDKAPGLYFYGNSANAQVDITTGLTGLLDSQINNDGVYTAQTSRYNFLTSSVTTGVKHFSANTDSSSSDGIGAAIYIPSASTDWLIIESSKCTMTAN